MSNKLKHEFKFNFNKTIVEHEGKEYNFKEVKAIKFDKCRACDLRRACNKTDIILPCSKESRSDGLNGIFELAIKPIYFNQN